MSSLERELHLTTTMSNEWFLARLYIKKESRKHYVLVP